MKIVLSGGGSGGHITPILAIAHELDTSKNTLIYIGEGTATERKLTAEFDTTYKIFAGKFRRYRGQSRLKSVFDIKTLLLNIRDGFKFGLGVLQAFWRLARLRPDRVFIKGGYVGLPVGVAAWILRIPLIIHESDSVVGLTNRLLKNKAKVRLSGFELEGWAWVGNPVRRSLLAYTDMDEQQGRAHFNVTSSRPVVLVIGGSLGSRALNEATHELAASQEEFEIIHILGRSQPLPDMGRHYHPYEFLFEDLGLAMKVADVVVSRAGANTLAELASLSKATIIVPHPHLSGNHQQRNAEILARNNAATLLHQSELSGSSLQAQIIATLQPERRAQLEESITHYFRPRSAHLIANSILSAEAPKLAGQADV